MSAEISIRSSVELPVQREAIDLHTADGLKLVGELATPIGKPPVATLITLHPLPTHGGFMDSHILRKASNRLPELAEIAVLRFNTRGTESPHGKSQGSFGEGVTEQHDVEAAIEFAKSRNLPNLWLVGWSFGTELALKYGHDKDIVGAILLSPPLHRANDDDLDQWAGNHRNLIALVPEHDDYLRPDQARERFSRIPHIDIVGVDGAKHLWVGENATKRVLDEIVLRVNPSRYPLPDSWTPASA
ncbi:alpha/beta hydrolase [Rhodoluna lacicola]|uniref:Putative hydrolase of the alpha/beta superfamily n=1 Tax=Rhodoluna lacicola TaxID=529884 RepID=A0A060JBU2_9MICO|nr:alpha/beta fold hydrolase [Rhodoluna lacicola]AIC47346.1 putative hydrolase of the alpha/beta superfamily [Rhodoluna lacicola]